MNKKFSTLVASILLASSVGTYVNAVNPLVGKIDLTAGTLSSLALETTNAADINKDGQGYVEGRSYFLGDGTNLLFAEGLSGNNTLRYEDVATKLANADLSDAAGRRTKLNVNRALWTLVKINAPSGAIAPTYKFVNKFTQTELALDVASAIASDKYNAADTHNAIALGGSQSEWLQAQSYKKPYVASAGSPMYAAVAGDKAVALVADNKGAVVLVNMAKADLAITPIKLNPYVLGGQNVFTLSPNQLNTMLGAAGYSADKNSFFSLTFKPAATVNGEANLWAQDLQAVAVKQFELEYGKAADAKEVKESAYSSFYPETNKTIATDTYSALTDVANVGEDKDVAGIKIGTAFNNTTSQWVTLRNRDGKYLVVDTAHVKGTEQEANKRITFAYDKLYNAKDETRFRDPRSYLFRFDYNPLTNKMDIVSFAYSTEATSTTPHDGNTYTAAELAKFYDDDYANQPIQKGSKWYADATIMNGLDNAGTDLGANTAAKTYITSAILGNVTEVTLGEKKDDNKFEITLGNSSNYQPLSIGSGAYILRSVSSGKYIVDNLVGDVEYVDLVKRQNLQDMPAAQWIVKSIGTTVSSISNREFENTLGYQGTSYGVVNGTNQRFFMGKDTLEFIPVTNLKDERLGYKYVAKDSINESIFTFNYLHELAMDKPINTKDDKDSVVWVDANGKAIKFVLEQVLDDAYGTNGGITSIANLKREVYKIRVKDESRLENNGRYLSYDVFQKKYKVSKEADKAGKFFLKENNEADGTCYYTLLEARITEAIPVEFVGLDFSLGTATSIKNADKVYKEQTSNLIVDNDLSGVYAVAEKVANGYQDPTTGVKSDGYKLQVNPSQVLAFTSIVTVGSDKYLVYTSQNVNYATSKVSVENNTLDLVNGVLSNGQSEEVATSAFAVKRDADPLYRRFNTIEEGVASDAPDTVKFYRVNATAKEYLYEDANSKYSKDKNFNFLGVEDKGVTSNSAIFVDTAYVRKNTRMPQYLLAVNPTFVQGDTVLCNATTHSHATAAEALACPHTKITQTYIDARYLVNLQDSVDVNTGLAQAKYQWNNAYTRLGFVDARHIHDTLVIKNSIYTGNAKPIVIGKAATWASKDSIYLGENTHKNVVFEFRLVKTGSNNFLIESESTTGIAPQKGGWVKIQNGVPVIAKFNTYQEAALDAEVFNVEKTSDAPTANDAIDTENVSIAAGNGNVTIKNAAGKTVAISNILGQAIAQTVLTSDNATISVPAGIVVVSVEGEDAVKAIVR